MSASDWIDSSGSMPGLKTGAAATGVFATILWGWASGLIEFVGSATSGIWGTIDAIRRFLASPSMILDDNGLVHPEGVIPWLFGIFESVLSQAALSHSMWLSSLGIFGQLVAFLEGVLFLVGVVWVLNVAISWIGRSI